MKSEIRDRLAALIVEVDAETMDRQLATIGDALAEPPPAPPQQRRSWRYRLAPVAAALTLFAPAAAVAAESSIPGDVLYPIKQVTEHVRTWFDADIAVDHRLEELETVLRRDATDGAIADRLDAATRAVTDLPADHHRAGEYRLRLDAARDRIAVRGGVSNDADGIEPGPTIDDAPQDRPVRSTTTDASQASRDAQRDTAATTTTAAAAATEPAPDRARDETDHDTSRSTTTTTSIDRDADGTSREGNRGARDG